MSELTKRRQFLSMSSLGVLGVLAGCSGAPSQDKDSTGTDRGTTPEDGVVEHDHQAGSSDFSDETLSRAKELGRTVQQSVVKLSNGGAGGTGWVIDDGYILTNSHVTREFETMDLETFDERTGTATRIGYHEDLLPDIALMETEIETPPPLSMKTNTNISAGDPVLTVGHPGRVGDWVISLGRYSTYERGLDWELSDIPTSQGNSGSPIVTLDGTVFGCVSGTTEMGGDSSKVDRAEKVYREFPEQESLATATPSKTIEKWVGEWR